MCIFYWVILVVRKFILFFIKVFFWGLFIILVKLDEKEFVFLKIWIELGEVFEDKICC